MTILAKMKKFGAWLKTPGGLSVAALVVALLTAFGEVGSAIFTSRGVRVANMANELAIEANATADEANTYAKDANSIAARVAARDDRLATFDMRRDLRDAIFEINHYLFGNESYTLPANVDEMQDRRPDREMTIVPGSPLQLHFYTARKIEQEMPELFTYLDYKILASAAYHLFGSRLADEYIEKGLAVARARQDRLAEIEMLLIKGQFLYVTGQGSSAQSAFEAGIALFRELGAIDRHETLGGEMYLAMAMSEYEYGSHVKGDEYFSRALELTSGIANSDIWKKDAEFRKEGAKERRSTN